VQYNVVALSVTEAELIIAMTMAQDMINQFESRIVHHFGGGQQRGN